MRQFGKSFFFSILVAAVAVVSAIPVSALTLPGRYPRTANYYLNPAMTDAEAADLARYDIVIVGMEQQYLHPQVFQIMRQKNPDIIILAYVLSEEMPSQYLSMTDNSYPQKQLVNGIASSWWVTTPSGQKTGFWPGANMLNVTNSAPVVNGQRWNTFLPQYMHDHVMSTGYWDGIFYDNVFNDVSWVNGGNIDLDRNGVKDIASTADAAWRTGMQTIMSRSRALEGNDKVILGNGGGQYYPAMNGRLIEEFPSSLDGGWSGAMAKYLDVVKRGAAPSIVIVNHASSGGLSTDYRSMRYGLASTMLGDGFFSFDQGSVHHANLWHYDEYDTDLGLPLGAAKNISGGSTASFAQGVWRRDFARGIVVVNATDTTQTIALGQGYEQITGTQDAVNGGKIVDKISLQPRDGRLLLKRNFTPSNAAFVNGALMQVFTASGKTTRGAFFTYSPNTPGGAQMVVQDLNRDGQDETIIANRGKVQILNAAGNTTTSFTPYAKYSGTLSIAVATLVKNGPRVVVVAPQGGSDQRVKVYSLSGRLQFSFRAFPRNIPGGVYVAAGDINNDGRDEMMAGAGKGDKPLVRVYDQKGKAVSQFYAYGKNFRGGVRVAAGDLTGDGRSEIITGPGPGGGPQVRILDRHGKRVRLEFFALSRSYHQGIFVSVQDIDHNGINRILVSTPVVY